MGAEAPASSYISSAPPRMALGRWRQSLGFVPWWPLALPQVPVTTFFLGLLPVFLAYFYTWYCFPDLFSLENRMQTIPLEAFFSELGLHVDTVPALQVFKTDL